ncbi:hypothetical protein [Noviherbaspirillum saxi]|uniref:Regulatory protein, RpfE type n=1 Tax=Noviherbaspirillum saxi TaxID=2320863 RepID=A0A3A3G800_9BURK|nr:hypothetical protein [Noviherbaspirillum saxi]RJF98275.1 hypothetical protein D3871_06930 [Noviherbaspirillum saxi]
MSHLDILIPFGLPPEELAPDLFRELNAPALATLTARAKSEDVAARRENFADFYRTLPHETWLARRFGLDGRLQDSGSPPVSTELMRALGQSVDEGLWFIVEPVHIHFARDHLVLTNPRQLMLTEPEARVLFEIAKPLFSDAGHDLRFGNARYWFLRADAWDGLQTSSPDAVSGHNIDIWMPKGAGERDWRKVQNEVQMHWHDHPLNAQREERRLKPVNSLWLWGAAAADMKRSAPPYDFACNLNDWMPALMPDNAGTRTAASAGALLDRLPERGLILLDDLQEAALSSDWAGWINGVRRIETDWCAPLLAALKSGSLASLSLVITNDIRLSRFTTTRTSLRKFWVKPSLATLCQ